MIQLKQETKDLLFSITKNRELLAERTQQEGEETIEFKLTKSRETFHFNPPVEGKENWMIGLFKFRGLQFYFYYNRRK